LKNTKGVKKMSNEIPIFFSTDDNYIPYLDVAISSLIANASKKYEYRIVVLNTGLKEENVLKVKRNERKGFKIDFIDISKHLEDIMSKFKDVYHFSIVTYYRLFIASLFPQYDKIVYLDCDLVILGDIAELYNIELNQNILGAAPEQYVQNTHEFRRYAEKALGVDPDSYFNAGVLLMNLKEYRKNEIEKKFIDLITKYDFDLLDPDQAYLNYLCLGKTHILPNGWNKEPMPLTCEGKKNIVHYALYKKPWQFDDLIDGDYFWGYAKHSPFYDLICQRREAFGEAEKAAKKATAKEILVHANQIVCSDYTFAKMLARSEC
jgi:lipopolysaccharide biosynthesis glycosyltransferase